MAVARNVEMTDRRRVYGRRETAEMLGCSEQTVAKMIAKGQLRTVIIGETRKITKTSIDAWLEAAEA
jgi:excisionase family DNA binding protein